MSEFIEASDLFLFIASVGIIVVTSVFLVVGYQTAKVLEEARALVRALKEEVGVFTNGRRALLERVQFAGTWVSSFLRILTKR